MRFLNARLADIRWGARWGLAISAIFVGYAAVTRAVAGPTAFDGYHMTFVDVLALYVGGGLGAGVVVGLLRPATHSSIGAFCVGFVAAFPVMLALWMFLRDRGPWGSLDAIVLVSACICLGSLPAMYWSQPPGKRS